MRASRTGGVGVINGTSRLAVNGIRCIAKSRRAHDSFTSREAARKKYPALRGGHVNVNEGGTRAGRKGGREK
jgi:hypothetical protein